MKKRTAVIIISLLSAAIVALGIFALCQNRKLVSAARVNEIYGERALNDLTDSLDEMDEALQKSLYATSAPLFSRLCTDAAASGASAVSAFSALPYSTHELEKTSKFINGAGDYVFAMSRAASEGKLPDAEEMKNISELSKTLKEVVAGLSDVRQALSDHAICLDDYGACSDDGADGTVGSELQIIESKLPEYPELIYDGQFSARSDDGEETEIAQEEAKRSASIFLGVPEQQLAFEGKSGGDLPCYRFSVSTGEGSDQQVAVTAKDGAIAAWMDSNRPSSGSVTEQDAAQTAADFLAQHGYGDMKELSRATNGGVCAVSFAYSGGGVVCMNDKIIVEVALDKGEVCSLLADEYYKNHIERAMTPAVSPDEAAKAVPDSLTIAGSRLVCTRLMGTKEYLCYEISCKSEDGSEVIIYVDAQTGEQKMIELVAS